MDFGLAKQDGGELSPHDDGGERVDGGADADGGSDGSVPDSGSDGGEPSTEDCLVRGEGTRLRPCLVRSCKQLQALADAPKGAYALVGDIDCEGFSAEDGAGFRPIGTRDAAFEGVLDGRGHSISNLTMQRENSDEVGLFGVTRGASISKLGLRGVDVFGRNYVGTLIGAAKEGTTVSQVFATGDVSGQSYVGGLVGDMIESSLTDSYTRADVVDASESGTPVNGGLLAGRVLHASTIGNCYAQSSNDWSLAPLVGDANDADSRVERSFYDCTAEGGLCQTYIAEGMTSIAITVPEHFVYAGWDYATPVWGERDDRARPCLRWESSCSAYDTGKLALEGKGTDAAPYEITRCKDLEAIAFDLDATYRVTSDIDCHGFDFGDGYGFFPIGTISTPFRGELRGGGHTIEGLRMLRRDRSDLGLFAKLGAGAVVRDLRFEDVVILGDYDVGVLAGTGSAGATIDGCYAQGILGTHYKSMDGNGLIGKALDTLQKDVVDEVVVTALD